jgi:homopolymeric O-antigen transport system ATP-binding protein
MTNIAIRVEGLGKQYRIGQRQQYQSLRESIMRGVAAPYRQLQRAFQSANGQHAHGDGMIWALKDISFEVKHGEVLGIIGRNGAGKSTLLKILSRTTEPTAGYADVFGRVGSLLEVGTGFHPELTGRENIYLNGAILGMRRDEIGRKFDEIVAFAEGEKFLDTAVKYYSSGMYMRLAFAVAAHLESDILVVDEVLAVGDDAFQKKCLGKMGAVAKRGRTVLLVSHNMGALNRLCSNAVWLDKGILREAGDAESVIGSYLLSNTELSGERYWNEPESQPGNNSIRLAAVRVLDPAGGPRTTFDMRHAIDVELEYVVLRSVVNPRMSIRLLREDGLTVFTSTDQNSVGTTETLRQPGRYVSRCRIPGNLLNAGYYLISAGCDFPFLEVVFFEEMTLGFRIEQVGGVNSRYPERWPGVITPDLDWSLTGAPTVGNASARIAIPHKDASRSEPKK